MTSFAAEELARFATDLLASVGVEREEAGAIAQSLVDANLRGYDSHGLMRVPQYVEAVRNGQIVPGAPFEVLREAPSVLTVDAHWGFGQMQARRLVDRLIEKARQAGVAVGTMIHSAHVGRLGEYCERAAAEGLIAMMMVNNHGAVRRVAPPGGKVARLATNPLAVGIPHDSEPVVLDFCTCAAAEGRIRVKRIAGQLCPDGWLLDSEGRPTNDPESLYADPPGTIRPMGGDQPYKGFGLSLMVEILSGALSGGVCSREKPITPMGNCAFLLVLDPDHFGGTEHFSMEVGSLIAFVRGCPTVEGVEEILLPGDPERRTLSERTSGGIPFDAGNWAQLTKLAGELGVPVPRG